MRYSVLVSLVAVAAAAPALAAPTASYPVARDLTNAFEHEARSATSFSELEARRVVFAPDLLKTLGTVGINIIKGIFTGGKRELTDDDAETLAAIAHLYARADANGVPSFSEEAKSLGPNFVKFFKGLFSRELSEDDAQALTALVQLYGRGADNAPSNPGEFFKGIGALPSKFVDMVKTMFSEKRELSADEADALATILKIYGRSTDAEIEVLSRDLDARRVVFGPDILKTLGTVGKSLLKGLFTGGKRELSADEADTLATLVQLYSRANTNELDARRVVFGPDILKTIGTVGKSLLKGLFTGGKRDLSDDDADALAALIHVYSRALDEELEARASSPVAAASAAIAKKASGGFFSKLVKSFFDGVVDGITTKRELSADESAALEALAQIYGRDMSSLNELD